MKTLYFSLGMMAGIGIMLFGFGCSKGSEHKQQPDSRQEDSFGIAGEPYNTFCTHCATDDLPGEPAAEFASVVARYRDNHQKLFNAFATSQLNNSAYPNPGTQLPGLFQDTRSCMFGIDRIKKFICLTERYAAQLNIPSSKLGIRFYYGIYPTNYTMDSRYSNMHTLYITATYLNSAGSYIDFDPRRSALTGTIVPLYRQLSANEPNIFVLGGRSIQQPGSVLNHGDLCPPGTGCDSTLTIIDQMAPARPLDATFFY